MLAFVKLEGALGVTHQRLVLLADLLDSAFGCRVAHVHQATFGGDLLSIVVFAWTS